MKTLNKTKLDLRFKTIAVLSTDEYEINLIDKLYKSNYRNN